MQHTLLVIRGLPGSGKTTVAKNLVSSGLFDIYLEADIWMKEHGVYKFDPAKLEHCHQCCQVCAAQSLETKNVIVSNTSLSRREVEVYRQIALRMNAHFQIMELKSPWKSVHNVPTAKLREMSTRWENLV